MVKFVGGWGGGRGMLKNMLELLGGEYEKGSREFEKKLLEEIDDFGL